MHNLKGGLVKVRFKVVMVEEWQKLFITKYYTIINKVQVELFDM